MLSGTQNHLDWNNIYKTVSSYAPTSQSLDTAKVFLWNHKEWILAGTVIGIVVLKIIHYIKNRPHMPIVDIKTTLNLATLNITSPTDISPPFVTLTFIIDLSESMTELNDPKGKGTKTRIDAVKEELQTLLMAAEQEYKNSKADISVVVVGFTTISEVITSITKINTPNKTKQIMDELNEYICDGGTDTLAGVEGGLEQLKIMAQANKQAFHGIFLLTDGDKQGRQGFTARRLSAIQGQITSESAELYVFGIGKNHDQEFLKQIIAFEKGTFRGKYFNTTSNNDLIRQEFAALFKRAVAPFRDLELTSPQLDSNAWSVVNTASVIENERSTYNLGSLSQGKTLNISIMIPTDKHIELSTVSFTLSFTDPKGRKGQVSLPWNPTTTIDPSIVSAWNANR